MPTDHNQGRRGHFHRGRRGPDRRGPERREGPAPEQPSRVERTDRVDVEQIMREIRARIAQRSGVDLSNQQIQELAARRLEAILDPRGLKPELLEQLRRSAGERAASADIPPPKSASQLYPFDEASLYDSPNALLRFLRKLLRPILRVLFNPTPIAHALALQSRLNGELIAREAESDRRQAEWNALHYEILRRLATEASRVSIETQSLALRVESLAAKVDFNERRVRGMEGTQARTPRPQEAPPPLQGQPAPAAQPEAAPPQPAAEGSPGEAPRRRRRRRRGRRGPGAGVPPGANAQAAAPHAVEVEDVDSDTDLDEGPEGGLEEEAAAPEPVPLDHRLPAAVERREDAAAPVEPIRPEEGTNSAPEE